MRRSLVLSFARMLSFSPKIRGSHGRRPWHWRPGMTPFIRMLRLLRSSSTLAPFIRVQLDLYSVYKGPARPFVNVYVVWPSRFGSCCVGRRSHHDEQHEVMMMASKVHMLITDLKTTCPPQAKHGAMGNLFPAHVPLRGWSSKITLNNCLVCLDQHGRGDGG